GIPAVHGRWVEWRRRIGQWQQGTLQYRCGVGMIAGQAPHSLIQQRRAVTTRSMRLAEKGPWYDTPSRPPPRRRAAWTTTWQPGTSFRTAPPQQRRDPQLDLRAPVAHLLSRPPPHHAD